MTVTINGEDRDTQASTVRDLVVELGLADRAVAVELNRHVVPRRRHDETRLSNGDIVEVVTLVGGG